MASDQSRPVAHVWSSEARSIASLLLFAHLCALVIAVTTYTRPSSFQQKLHGVFAPYLRTLHFTAYPTSYPFARYYLTHALPIDVDFTCEVTYRDKDGQTHTEIVPQPELRPLVRERRYQALANAAGALADAESNEDYSGILPRAIAGSILKRAGATQGTVRLQANYIPPMELMDETDPAKRVPAPGTTYEAQVFISGGNVELLKKSTTLEVAPVETRGAPRNTTPSPPGTRQP